MHNVTMNSLVCIYVLCTFNIFIKLTKNNDLHWHIDNTKII